MKILVVDDDESRRKGLVAHLVSCGAACSEEIDEADCSDKARDLLRNQYYDTLVLDVVLPKRSKDIRGASATHGMALLSQLEREAFLKKPEKIIGMTAHVDDLATFQAAFAEICSVVVETRPASDEWKGRIRKALAYTSSSKLSRKASEQRILVLTIHGIRTYGAWQARLKKIVERHTDKVEFRNYRYGYFSALSFLLPRLRKREAARIEARIGEFSRDIGADQVVIFCHSFGTYLAASALKRLISQEHGPEVRLVLAGSVLDENYDWSFVPRNGRFRIINDCGVDDFILLLSKAFGVDLGMAGKVGFHGFNDARFVNRYFRGGHSHYFDGDRFLEERWLPLVGSGDSLADIDERGTPGLFTVVAEGLAKKIGYLKQLLLSW